MKKLNQNQWLSIATVFNLGLSKHYMREVNIIMREQKDGSKKWIVKMDSWTLGKDGEFHYEPTPSNRTDEYINNTRFETKEKCLEFWIENVKEKKPLYYN